MDPIRKKILCSVKSSISNENNKMSACSVCLLPFKAHDLKVKYGLEGRTVYTCCNECDKKETMIEVLWTLLLVLLFLAAFFARPL